jgi:hypothetical protein
MISKNQSSSRAPWGMCSLEKECGAKWGETSWEDEWRETKWAAPSLQEEAWGENGNEVGKQGQVQPIP